VSSGTTKRVESLLENYQIEFEKLSAVIDKNKVEQLEIKNDLLKLEMEGGKNTKLYKSLASKLNKLESAQKQYNLAVTGLKKEVNNNTSRIENIESKDRVKKYKILQLEQEFFDIERESKLEYERQKRSSIETTESE
jgi:chromosome segregation ATPase